MIGYLSNSGPCLPPLPKIVRKKEPPTPLFVEPGSFEEHRQRADLWREFSKFVNRSGGWVVSQPERGRVLVQVPHGSPFLEKMKDFPKYGGTATRPVHGMFVPVQNIEVELWRDRDKPCLN